jgi:hypothetical protein
MDTKSLILDELMPRYDAAIADLAGTVHRGAGAADQPEPPDRPYRRLALIRGRLDAAKQVAHAHGPR